MTRTKRIGPMLRLVMAAGWLLAPFGPMALHRRLGRGKEDPDRWREKLGEAGRPRPDGPLVWLHGVGLGEALALRSLIAAMGRARPDLHFLLTSSARSSAAALAGNLPPRTQHQYLPLDLPGPVTRFLDHWRPDLAIWSDQDIWPRLVVATHRRGIPQAYVAARITPASGRAKARFGAAFCDLYRLLDLRHAQDEGTAQQLRSLMGGDAEVAVTGSLKPAAAPLADLPDLRARLPQDRPIWLAASAHRADIDVALVAQTALPDHLLIIAPRDLADADHVKTACARLGLSCTQRSAEDWPTPATHVFLADSFAELGAWYRAAHAALIGGTFDATEGHNPWEAAALDCAILHGPRTANFTDDFKALEQANAATKVTSAQELATALTDADLAAQTARAGAVREAAAANLARISDDLLGLLRR